MANKNQVVLERFPVITPETKRRSGKYSGKMEHLTISAGAMIFAHNKILLNRSDSSDLWSIPGGTIALDESPVESVKRHLQAELGLEIEVIPARPLIFSFTLSDENDVERVYLLHFLTKIIGSNKILMGEDIIDYHWASIASNFQDCYPNVRPAIDHYLNL
jgi:8-oxo-dGTP pyrophosphatase MutT (NUDIX family)